VKSKICIGLTVFATALMYPAAAWAAVTFASAVHYGAGSKPDSVAIGDLNGDGKLDLATANTASNNVSVLLGNGTGTFAAAVNYAAGAGAGSVVIRDLNADSKLDLVTANTSTGANSVSVLLGNGNGTFSAAVLYPVGTKPSSVAVGDLNGDGKPDLATANSGSTTVSVLLGNGNGTFSAAVNYGGIAGAAAIAIGDLNNDGKADLLTANPVSTRLAVLLGNGDGTFGPMDTPYGGDYPLALALADLNGDGKLDVVVANVTNNTVGVLLGNGSGGVGNPANYAAGNGPVGVAISDLDGDGKLDIAAANQRGDSVSVLTGNGNGTFAAAVQYPVGDGSLAVAIADFDGDGLRDVATANVNSNNVSVLSNATVVPFTTGPTATISGTAKVGQTLTAGEGTPDPTQDSFEYQWHADGIDIGSATNNTLVLTTAQVGKKITVTVTAKKAGYTDATDTSDETAAVTADFTTSPTATISGTAKFGQTLTAGEGTPDPTQDSFEYQWHADGVDIGSATAKTLVLSADQVGKKITVTVTAKKAGYTDATDTSDETGVVVGVFAPGPTATITGTVRIGSTLTAHQGSVSPTPDATTYRWYADGKQISGATSSTLKLGKAQVGKRITVRVYVTKSGYDSADDLSEPTSKVSGLAAKRLDLEPDEDTVRVGQRVSPVEISGLSKGEEWTLLFDGTELKSGTASKKGTVRTFYVVPKTTKGKHILRVNGRYADRYDTDKLTVK